MYVDVSSRTTYEAAFERCVKQFGGIDVVINNAAMNGDANWETVIDINLKGTIHGCQLAVKYMGTCAGGKGGEVVNISSVQGLMAWPAMPAYSASKGGIIKYTRYVSYSTNG